MNLKGFFLLGLGLSRTMRMRVCLAILVASMLLNLAPLASADDDLASSELMQDGQSVNGNADYDSDKEDWWKIYVFTGDVLTVAISSSSTAWDGGYTGNVKLTGPSGGTLAGENSITDDSSSTSLSTTAAFAGWIHLRVYSEDSWFADGFDYSLAPSLDKYNRDSDDDGFIDTEDDCDDIAGASTNDRLGCIDSDSDGYSDGDNTWAAHPDGFADAFPSESSQWRDSDRDGYGDNLGGFQGDHCLDQRGASSLDRHGCIDSDLDGWSDADPSGQNSSAPWPAHPEGSADAFPFEISQWNDTDADGYGDNWADWTINSTRENWSIGQWIDNASRPDSCPFITGYSNQDRFGCPDGDDDGWSDGDGNWTNANGADAFPTIPSQWSDVDGDGWGDNQTLGAEKIDDFIDNPTQWRDGDGDGWGDNHTYGATQIDKFPIDNSQWADSDGDGFGDNINGKNPDNCPDSSAEEVDNGWISWADRHGCRDSDMDGYSNPDSFWIAHPDGFADAFSNDKSQWRDSDGDSYGDNLEYFDGNAWREAWRGDGCLSTVGNSTFDRWGCPDSDSDGWSDPTLNWLASPAGSGDTWPEDDSQWHDVDGDGRGDAPTGTDADVCPDTPGTSVGSREGGDRWGCPDTDGDGWSDLGDTFIHEPTQWRDSDGDGFGDQADGHEADACPLQRGNSIFDRMGCRDSDGDGWSDPTEDWQAAPWGTGDAFPNDRFQWLDADEDGFGDNPLGSARDDCPEVSGSSTRDIQGCPDSDGDGWSDEYGGFASAIAGLGENPAGSLLSYMLLGGAIMLGALAAAVVRLLRGDQSFNAEDLKDKSVYEAVYEQQPAHLETPQTTGDGMYEIIDDLFQGGDGNA